MAVKSIGARDRYRAARRRAAVAQSRLPGSPFDEVPRLLRVILPARWAAALRCRRANRHTESCSRGGFRDALSGQQRTEAGPRRLRPARWSPGSKGADTVYVYADPQRCGCFYVGGPQAYAQYRDLALSEAIAQDSGEVSIIQCSRARGSGAPGTRGSRDVRRRRVQLRLALLLIGTTTGKAGKPASAGFRGGYGRRSCADRSACSVR